MFVFIVVHLLILLRSFQAPISLVSVTQTCRWILQFSMISLLLLLVKTF